VQDAAEELSIVNQALEHEVNERHLLEHQLAAAEKQEEAARHASFHDPLTGLPNRVLFNDRLEHGLAQAKRHNWTLAVMFLDLNGFKGINDTYGHDIGDRVLQTISQRLTENTRDDDTVSRHGGDEFLYLLMEVRDERDIALIAQNILNVIQVPCNVGVHDLTISASIGISIFRKTAPPRIDWSRERTRRCTTLTDEIRICLRTVIPLYFSSESVPEWQLLMQLALRQKTRQSSCRTNDSHDCI